MLRLTFLLVIPLFIFTGCGDLGPEMQDTRTVILNMDFDQRSSSRTSNVSAFELSQYNTHLILAVPSLEYLTSSYRNYYSSFAQGLMNTSDKKVSLEIPLNTQMKIFAFLFKETYSLSDLISGYQEVGYYGESQPFSIGTNTNNLSLPITLIPVPGTGTDTDTGSDDGNDGGTDTDGGTHTDGGTDIGGGSNDTTPPVIEEFSGITTPTTDTTPDYTFSSSEAGPITYGGSCATAGSATTNAIVGHTLITFNTLSDGSYINCTITVTDSAGNASNTLTITSFTVNTTVTNVTLDTTLLAHYAFEGNLFDNSSYNRDLTEDTSSNITYSAADNTSNRSGRAALFNGTNTYAYTDNITLSDNFTIAFWTVPFSSSMSQWDSALSSGNSTSSGIFQIDFNDNNTRFCAANCILPTTLNSDVWNHIVITKTDSTDNNTIRMYTDGEPRGNASQITTLWERIKIGVNRSFGRHWNGYIDELKIYNRTFSAQEVADLHDSY